MAVALLPKNNNNNNWAANAIVNFVGPLIGDWIKSEREKEINRKNNAALNEVINRMNLGNNDFSNLPPSLSGNNSGLLGGSNNGWENAFRNISDNPTSQFDNNTANIAPNANVSATLNQPQQHIPTPAEFLQNMYSVVGSDTKRFGLVNLENLQKLAAPIMAAYENSRNEQRRKEIGETLKNSANSPERLANIWNAVTQGILPMEAIAHARAESQPYNIDTGSSINRGIFDYATGKYVDQDALAKSLTPQEKQAAIQWGDSHNEGIRRTNLEDARYYAGLEAQKNENAAIREQRRYEFDSTMQHNKEMADWEHGMKERQFESEDDFRKWLMQQQEEIARTGRTVNKDLIEQLNKDYDRLDAEEKAIQETINERPNNNANVTHANRIKEIQAEKQAIRQGIYSLYFPKPANTTSSTQSRSYDIPKISLGSQMIGNANAGRITGRFGDDRKDHKHAGTDYPVREGTPIHLQEFWGDNLTVKRVNTNPNASSYGNFVELEGNVAGQNVSFLMAHMKTGSARVKKGDNVKAGDIIGEVGNTGRSRGAHLHLEVRVNGQRIDPEKYFSIMQPHAIKYSQNNNNNNSSNLTPFTRNNEPSADNNNTQQQSAQNSQTANAQSTSNNNSPVLWKHSNGKTISVSDYEEFVKMAEAGKIKGLKSREDADKYLQNNGYSRKNTANSNNDDNDPVVLRNPDTGKEIRQSKIYEHINKDGWSEDYAYQLYRGLGFKRVLPDSNNQNNSDRNILPPSTNQSSSMPATVNTSDSTQNNSGNDFNVLPPSNNNNSNTISGSLNYNNDDSVMLISHDRTKGISKFQYAQMEREADAGQYRDLGINSRNDIMPYLEQHGFKKPMWLSKDGKEGITQEQYEKELATIREKGSWTAPDTGEIINSPEQFDAYLERNGMYRPEPKSSNQEPPPAITDNINHTTSQDLLANLNHLNGVNTTGNPVRRHLSASFRV